MRTASRIPLIIGAVIAVVLQLVLAPNIQIFTAEPNFILCYVVALAVLFARDIGYTTAFILGIIYDFSGDGPVGAMAFVCVAATFFAALFMRLLDNETVIVPIIIIICVVFASELAYGLLMMACGVDVGFFEMLGYAVLPNWVYDAVLSLIAYPLVLRFVFTGKKQNEMTIIDSKIN